MVRWLFSVGRSSKSKRWIFIAINLFQLYDTGHPQHSRRLASTVTTSLLPWLPLNTAYFLSWVFFKTLTQEGQLLQWCPGMDAFCFSDCSKLEQMAKAYPFDPPSYLLVPFPSISDVWGFKGSNPSRYYCSLHRELSALYTSFGLFPFNSFIQQVVVTHMLERLTVSSCQPSIAKEYVASTWLLVQMEIPDQLAHFLKSEDIMWKPHFWCPFTNERWLQWDNINGIDLLFACTGHVHCQQLSIALDAPYSLTPVCISSAGPHAHDFVLFVSHTWHCAKGLGP